MSRTEVTFEQWDACVTDGGCDGQRPDDEGWGRGSRPVINISWEEARLFADWLSGKTGARYRLPTEAEWEYAARSGVAAPYAFGDTNRVCEFANGLDRTAKAAGLSGLGEPTACSDGFARTAPTASFKPGTWGLFDMAGNVQEWVLDCYANRYGAAPARADCAARVVRGGSFLSPLSELRSSARTNFPQDSRANSIGFRVVRDP
jgi:formylglycine-generating enzyme required for sulfatase activity